MSSHSQRSDFNTQGDPYKIIVTSKLNVLRDNIKKKYFYNFICIYGVYLK